MTLWFDDFTPGRRFRTAGATITEAQILDFAFRFDPQPFHMDKLAAEKTAYGGLIASGFHTMVVGFRLWHAENIMNACSQGSPGLDELRWPNPVRPGDTIHMDAEVVEARASRSKPDRGLVTIAYTILNQRDEPVMTYRCIHIFLKDPATVAPG
jgi:acyl dehydratase